MKKLIKIIKKREELAHDAPAYFIKELEKIQNRLYYELINIVKGMDDKKNKLQPTRFNLSLIEKMRREISGWLRNAGYFEQVTSFGKQYEELMNLAKDYYAELGFDSGFLKRDLEALKTIRRNDLNFLNKVADQVVNVTYSEALSAVFEKKDWRDLAERFREIHLDDTQSNGLLKRYAQTYAFTAFAGFDRRVQQVKATQYGIERFLYSGSLIHDSREFCKERVNKIFSRKEIESWNKLKWKGKAEGRDIWTFLGGWNCRHILTPVTDEFEKELADKGTVAVTTGQIKKDLIHPNTLQADWKGFKIKADDIAFLAEREFIPEGLKNVLIKPNKRLKEDVLGQFVIKRQRGTIRVWIDINKEGFLDTVAHEVFHAYHAKLTKNRFHIPPEFERLFEAIKNSAAYERLKKNKIGMRISDWRYFFSEREILARCYQQYVGKRLYGESWKEKAGISGEEAYFKGGIYWDDEDFAPIEKILEETIERLKNEQKFHF